MGIQQNGANTGDISYAKGAVTDNAVVGVDLGNSMGAAFRSISTNGQNGPGGDFRGSHYATHILSIDDCMANPVQGPFLNFAIPSGQPLHATQIVLRNCAISWDGPPGGRIIDYQGYGSVTLIGGSVGDNGVIYARRFSPVMYSGAKFIDVGVQFWNNPEPTVDADHRFSVLSTHRNVAIGTGVRGRGVGGPPSARDPGSPRRSGTPRS